MFTTTFEIPPEELTKLNNELDKFSEHIRFVAIRAGANAAAKPFHSAFQRSAAARSKREPPLRRDRSTGQYIIRPHLADSITSKVWRIPDGTGYMVYIGPMSKEEPHAHLLEEGTAPRFHKSGHFTGSGPAKHILAIAYTNAKNAAGAAFAETVQSKLAAYARDT